MDKDCAPAIYPTATPIAAQQNAHPVEDITNIHSRDLFSCQNHMFLVSKNETLGQMMTTGVKNHERVRITEVKRRVPSFTIFLNVRQTQCE